MATGALPFADTPALRVAFLMGQDCPGGRESQLLAAVLLGDVSLAGPPGTAHHAQFLKALVAGLGPRAPERFND